VSIYLQRSTFTRNWYLNSAFEVSKVYEGSFFSGKSLAAQQARFLILGMLLLSFFCLGVDNFLLLIVLQ